MDVHISTRKCRLTEEEHELFVKAAEQLTRFHDSINRVDVVALEDAGVKWAEFAVRVQGHTVVAREHGPDHVKALNDAKEKVVRQLQKIKQKQQAGIQ